MKEVFQLESGAWGIQGDGTLQEFWPFKEGYIPMAEEEARQIAACMDSPAGAHWTGSEVVPRLVLSADKSQVIADDTDTATITATIADPTNTDVVTFEMDGQVLAQVTPESREARLVVTFAPGNEGTKVITATHPRFGRNEVRLEVVPSGA